MTTRDREIRRKLSNLGATLLLYEAQRRRLRELLRKLAKERKELETKR